MDRALLEHMLELDDRHWWYRGRRQVLAAVLDSLPLPPGARILDAGCGSGATMDELSHRGEVSGMDVSGEAVAAALSRGHRDVRVAAVERLPFPDRHFELVTCLDVIEHTPDDRASLAELRRVTAVGGHAVVTVPAYQSLWSAYDEANHHHRRYRLGSLAAAAEESGWQLRRLTAFNTLLLPVAAVVRVGDRLRRAREAEFDSWLPSPRVGALLELPNRLEARLLRSGRRLPFGLSLLAVLANPRA